MSTAEPADEASLNTVVPRALVVMFDFPAVALSVNVTEPALLAIVEPPADDELLKFRDPVFVMLEEPALLVSRKFVVPALAIAFVPNVAPLLTFMVAGPST